MPYRSGTLVTTASFNALDQYVRRYNIREISVTNQGKTLRECTDCRPDIGVDPLLHTLHSINTIVENACLSDGQLFDESEYGELSKVYSKHRGHRFRRHPLRQTRAELSLFNPLEGVIVTLQDMCRQVKNWRERARSAPGNVAN